MFKSKDIKDLEERLYNKVAGEISSGEFDQGLWAKALSISNGDKQKTQSSYIRLRVEKLKEKSVADFKERRSAQKEHEKDLNSLETLEVVPPTNAYRFKFISILLLAVGALGMFASQLFDPNLSSDINIYFSLLFFGGLFVLLALLGLWDGFKIEKETDKKAMNKRMKRQFLIMIPASLLMSLIGLASVIIGIIAFVVFIRMIFDAYSYNKAYNRAITNNLI